MHNFKCLTLLLLTLLSSACSVSIPLFRGEQPLGEAWLDGQGKQKILMITVDGTISSQESKSLLMGNSESTVDAVKSRLDLARNDDNIVALILRVNSPGGGVTASDTIYHELARFKAEKKIPVVAFFGDMSASGGYYISMCADEIVAQPTTITGSIGVIAMYVNVEGLMSKIGVEAQVVRSGKMKAIPNPFERAGPEQIAWFQGMINEMYGKFVDTVAAGRKKLTRERIVELADGRIYTANQAFGNGLIDRVGYFEDALARARELSGCPDAMLVTYTKNMEAPNRTVYSSASAHDAGAIPAATALADNLGLLSDGPAFHYLWSPQ